MIKVRIYGEVGGRNGASAPQSAGRRLARHAHRRLPAHHSQNPHHNYHHQLTHLDKTWLASAGDVIQELVVEGNRIKAIHSGDLDGLPHLKSLKLRRNRIRMIRGPAFNSVRDLEELDLSRNHLKWFGKRLFGEMRRLKRLNVAKNRLRTLDNGVFVGLRSLEHLNLARNRLERVDADLLRYNGNLRRLILDHNRLAEISYGAFASLHSLTHLSVANNSLPSVPSTAFAGATGQHRMLSYLNVDRNRLTEVSRRDFYQFPGLKILRLVHNNITHVGSYTFVDLELLERLSLDWNRIRSLEVGCFHGLKNLRRLSLSHNLVIELRPEVFRDPVRLERLDFSHNELDVIATRTFDGLHHLRELRLDYNRLRAIEQSGLAVGTDSAQIRLTWLYLDHNELDRISRPMLDGLSYVKFLSARNNRINHIEVEAFRSSPRLITLLLQQNEIGRLQSGAFKSLRALRHLNLASNRIRDLQRDAFVGLEHMDDISLDGNQLTQLDYRAFNFTPRLKSLSARGNRLRVVDLRILDWTQRLRSLELAGNLISKVIPPVKDEVGVSSFRGLSLLSLSNNSLTVMDEKVKDALKRDGAVMRVHDNPWYCDCRLNWLVTIVRGQSAHRVDKRSRVLCNSPPYLTDRTVITEL